MRTLTLPLAAVAVLGLVACGGDDAADAGASGAGAAGATSSTSSGDLGLTMSAGTAGTAGTASTSTGPNDGCGQNLSGVVRDFRDDHPDMEAELGSDPGIVEPTLGADGKPVYAGDTPTTHGQEAFDQWFRDTPGVNEAIPISLPLTAGDDGVARFDDPDFFPIDGQGFGNQDREHNFHFTLEIRTLFEYQGGEVFTFTGDDDLFTYINGRLAIDLGGVHGAMSQTIDLDAQADALEIIVGGKYPLDFFFAERHTSESSFRIETTIGCFTPVTPPP